ncbi:MAG: phosphodiester glycosidase family protein [Cyanobacteria bacterium P01_F01_bin.3]
MGKGAAIAQNAPRQSPESSTIESTISKQLAAQVTTYDLPQATVRVASFPKNVATLSVAVANDLETISAFATRGTSDTPLSIINGGFFDPQNGKTTSHLTVNGEVVGDPTNNERLVENPDLQQYLPQILNRSEFRIYRCDTELSAHAATRYDITFHNAAIPAGCEIESAVGAGPQLLPDNTSEQEAFTDYDNNGELIRDAIGSMNPNARSAIGLDADGSVYFILIEKTAELPGLTLAEMSEFADSIGIEKLLNLDGGSSSSLRFDGQTYHGRIDANGNPIERPIKSVIVAH